MSAKYHPNYDAPLRPVKNFSRCLHCEHQGAWHGASRMVRCRLECEGKGRKQTELSMFG